MLLKARGLPPTTNPRTYTQTYTPTVVHMTDGMMVSVVRTGFRDTAQRRSAEGCLIFKCQTLQPRGMNIDFSLIYPLQRELQYCDMATFELFK